MRRYKIPETLDIRDVPSHYIPISQFGCHNSGKPATLEYRSVRHAIDSGLVKSTIKFKRSDADNRGQIFVDPADIKVLLDEARRKSDERLGVAVHDIDHAGCGGSRTLETISATSTRIASAVERIAEALEMLATQPAHRRVAFEDATEASWNSDIDGEDV